MAQGWGLTWLANRPDPDDPGGLGAEESGTERTGPTQWLVVAVQVGGRLSEIGRYYDSANDPVTANPSVNFYISATALLQRRAVGAIMSAAA
ncbi:MAG: hypothetical protein QOJ84_2704 [Bradyrhizobium sp.]|nr:hypothetical protein [Bradyrhizobium sp.]